MLEVYKLPNLWDFPSMKYFTPNIACVARHLTYLSEKIEGGPMPFKDQTLLSDCPVTKSDIRQTSMSSGNLPDDLEHLSFCREDEQKRLHLSKIMCCFHVG